MNTSKCLVVLVLAGCAAGGPDPDEGVEEEMRLQAGCLIETQHKWDGEIAWRSFETYDDAGGTVLEEWDYDDDGSIDATVFRENNGLGSPLLVETYEGTDELLVVEAYEYDAFGHLIRYEKDEGSAALGVPDGEPDEVQTFVVLPDGSRILADLDFDGDGAWDERFVHDYDADGYPLGWVVVDPEGVDKRHWFQSWSADHSEVLHVWDHDADGYPDEALREFYEDHDDDERLVANEGDSDGDWEFEQSWTFEYDGDQLVRWQGGVASLQEEYTATYDPDGRIDKVKLVVVLFADDPNPEEVKVFWDYTWTCPAP